MENRRRGLSFHEQDDSGPPAYEHMKFLDEEDSTTNSSVDDSDEEDEEELPRTRSRSRSMHAMDDIPNGVTPYVPSVTPQSSESTTVKIMEKTGPITPQVETVLQKAVDEAIQKQNPEDVKDTEAEIEEERLSRHAKPSGECKRVKILMLGDSGVGKSSLIIRWTQDTFSTDLVGTVGVNFKTKRVSVDGGDCQVQVWDTAGQEQFHKITTSYYKGVNGILLVYDVSDQRSLDNVSYWIKNIKSHATDSVQVALVGNKIDLRTVDLSRCIDVAKAHDLIRKYGVPYFETSAKDATNVDKAFLTLVGNVVRADKAASAPTPTTIFERPELRKKKSSASGGGCKQS